MFPQDDATKNCELALKVKLDTPSLGDDGTTVSLFGFALFTTAWPNMVNKEQKQTGGRRRSDDRDDDLLRRERRGANKEPLSARE